jgi:hypothetical protein
VKRFLHLVELEGFDNRLDLFHRLVISPSRAPLSRSHLSITYANPARRCASGETPRPQPLEWRSIKHVLPNF